MRTLGLGLLFAAMLAVRFYIPFTRQLSENPWLTKDANFVETLHAMLGSSAAVMGAEVLFPGVFFLLCMGGGILLAALSLWVLENAVFGLVAMAGFSVRRVRSMFSRSN